MRIESISDYQIKFSDKFFIDTNVWLYLLYPQSSLPSKSIIQAYSDFHHKLLNKGSLILTHPIQLSELINAVISIEYKLYTSKYQYQKLKDWKKTQDFNRVRSEAQDLAKNITRQSSLISGTFAPSELEEIVDNCDQADFNDLFFVKFAEKEQMNIITHDGDYNVSLDFSQCILTANINLLDK